MKMKKRSKILLLIIILLVIIIAIVMFFCEKQFKNPTNTCQNTDSSSLIVNNENGYIGSSSSDETELDNENMDEQYDDNDSDNDNIDTDEPQETDDSNSTFDNSDSSESPTTSDDYVWNGERLPNRTDNPVTSDSGANADYYNDDTKLDKIDKDLASRNATTFVNGFFTYTKKDIANNAYKTSFSSVLSDNFSSDIKNQLSNENLAILANWNAKSTVQSVSVKDVYVSHLTNENKIAVRLDAQIYKNQGNPGEQDWKIMKTVKQSISVYLNSSYKVIDYRVNSTQLL